MDELKMFVEMDSQGRIVIPKQIREYLGLKKNIQKPNKKLKLK